ncbi:hypothetical protein BgiMline_017221, partial [Biomphalaria glabrata]
LHDRCMPAKQHIRLVTEIWPWVDTLIYSLIPFLTITVLNIFIIKEVAGARSNRMLLSGSENDNYILATNHRNSNVANQRRSNQNEGSRLTALLLTVSFTFLVLTLPFNIVMIITRLWNDTSGKNNELQSMAQFQLIQAITELLMYTNHSVNFFLYCATGHKFRQQILDLFRCLYRRQARGSNNTTLTNAQSIRRNSQSVISGGGEVMVVLRSDQSRGSSLSLNVKDDLNETDHDAGHVSSVKSCSGKSYSSRGSLFKSDSSLNSSAYSNPCNGKSRTFVGNSRNSETFFSKRDSSMRACYGFYRSQSSQEQQKHDTVQNGTHKRVPKSNNNASCKIFYSSKKHKPSPLTLSRSSFGSLEDCSLKDREYIVLQPTIRWCEASVQS